MAYKVFICHAYDHQQIYEELRRKLNDASRFDWRNLSVQYDMRYGDAEEEVGKEELRALIGKRIEECDVLLVLTKPIASRRKWLQWEIARAAELGKPIIGIARKRNDRVSRFVRQHADDIVDSWRVEHIINAIVGYADEYRQQQAQKPHRLAELPPLPVDTPDEELEAEPTPAAPDDVIKVVQLGGTALPSQPVAFERELPRDVLFRDIGSIVPGRIVGPAVKHPRWWWPFSQRSN